MAFPGEVGLRVLLSPFGSNVLVRTACCSVGIALPVYSTFKAIEQKDQAEQQKWLLYWAAYGSFSIAEVFSDKILSWFPLYHHMKFAFLVWLQLPASNGAKHLYMRHMRPFLLRHQAQLDRAVEFIYGQMTKFIKSHQGEIQFARAIFMKILASVSGVVKGFPHSEERQSSRAIEAPAIQTEDSAGPAKQTEDSESENDD